MQFFSMHDESLEIEFASLMRQIVFRYNKSLIFLQEQGNEINAYSIEDERFSIKNLKNILRQYLRLHREINQLLLDANFQEKRNNLLVADKRLCLAQSKVLENLKKSIVFTRNYGTFGNISFSPQEIINTFSCFHAYILNSASVQENRERCDLLIKEQN